jgi:large subunit ribosomal protein L9
MKVILQEDLPNLGKSGEIIKVSPGYARNYLIPQGLATKASSRSLKQLEHQKRLIAAKKQKLLKDANLLKEKLESLSFTVTKRVTEEDKLYGAVTPKEIEEAIKGEGITLDKKNILLEKPIKTLGIYSVPIKIYKNIVANIKLWVVAY